MTLKGGLPPRAQLLYQDLDEVGSIRVHKAWLKYDTPYKQLGETELVKFKDIGGSWLEMVKWYSGRKDREGSYFSLSALDPIC
jgi:hypothetical protein